MSLKIIWSEFAENQLNDIYEYYKKEVSLLIAKKLVKDIINASKILSDASYIGQ